MATVFVTRVMVLAFFAATSVDLESITVADLEELTGGRAAEPLPIFGNAFHTHDLYSPNSVMRRLLPVDGLVAALGRGVQ